MEHSESTRLASPLGDAPLQVHGAFVTWASYIAWVATSVLNKYTGLPRDVDNTRMN